MFRAVKLQDIPEFEIYSTSYNESESVVEMTAVCI